MWTSIDITYSVFVLKTVHVVGQGTHGARGVDAVIGVGRGRVSSSEDRLKTRYERILKGTSS